LLDELHVEPGLRGALAGEGQQRGGNIRADHAPFGADDACGGQTRLSIATTHIQDRPARSNARQLDEDRAVALAAVLAFDNVVPFAPPRGGITPLLSHLLLEGDRVKGWRLRHAALLSGLAPLQAQHSVCARDGRVP
jgi:hypothetical protein